MLRGCRRTFADIVRGRRSGSDAFAEVAETKWRRGGNNRGEKRKTASWGFRKRSSKKARKDARQRQAARRWM